MVSKDTKGKDKPAPKKGTAKLTAPKVEAKAKAKGKGDGPAKKGPEEFYVKSTAPTTPPRLHERYNKTVVPALAKQFSYKNLMQVPRVDKVVLNIGMGEYVQNAKSLEFATEDVRKITGQ